MTSVKYSRVPLQKKSWFLSFLSNLLASRDTKLLLKEKCVRGKTKFYCTLNSANSVEAMLA